MNNQTILLPRSDQLFQYTCQTMIDLAAPLRETDWVLDIALTGAAGFLRQALWVRPGASKNLLRERWT